VAVNSLQQRVIGSVMDKSSSRSLTRESSTSVVLVFCPQASHGICPMAVLISAVDSSCLPTTGEAHACQVTHLPALSHICTQHTYALSQICYLTDASICVTHLPGHMPERAHVTHLPCHTSEPLSHIFLVTVTPGRSHMHLYCTVLLLYCRSPPPRTSSTTPRTWGQTSLEGKR
jgi:hypothetical protein